ncbi:BQ2448_2744 [Microbotryum intermedium]|uniref:BQ2448_2744 protein n=1 Tax=Microbotryum intermedium TaxID=269621 RepID=A0A238FJA7_9BASI|nr:BQ2448_2744 [Microbotryum intermedium]
MARPASHTELRQRSQAFANKAGKSNPLKKAPKLETQKNSISRRLFIVFFLLLAGGRNATPPPLLRSRGFVCWVGSFNLLPLYTVFFEIGQLVLDQIWPPVTKFNQPRRP